MRGVGFCYFWVSGCMCVGLRLLGVLYNRGSIVGVGVVVVFG